MTTYRAWNLKPLDRSALKELTAAIAQQSTEELEHRAMETMDGEPWSEEKYQMTLAAQQKEAGLLAGILAARGITDPAEALTLLSGEEELTDPMLLTDMDKACARSHRPALPAPQRDGSQRQVHAAQPRRRWLRPFQKCHPVHPR